MDTTELLTIVGGHVNEELLLRIEYVALENRILRSKLPGRVPLNDDERRLLAEAGHRLGRKALADVATIVTPETIFAWYRRLIAQKWNHSEKRGRAVGRPPIDLELEDLVLRLARETPRWGYDRIAGALRNLGHDISDETVGNVLRRHGIPPAPGRKPKIPWSEFIASHQDTLVAADFFTAEVLTPMGLLTLFVLFFIHVGSREVHIAGITPHPDEAWMDQTARELTMEGWGFLSAHSCTHLILDRDTKFSAAFRRTFKNAGIKVLRLPPRSPNLNAFAERFVRNVRDECLSHLILIGERSLRRALEQFLAHYHEERNHQGVGNVLLFPNALSPEASSLSTTETFASAMSSSPPATTECDDCASEPALAEWDVPPNTAEVTSAESAAPPAPASTGEILCKERLGGLLRYYYRKTG